MNQVITPVPTRFYSLDALRALAMLAGIFVHATHSFFIDQWSGVGDVSKSYFVLTGTYLYLHQFRLHAFFFVAGFFAHMLLKRDGVKVMLRERTKRILLPFLVGMVTLIPLMHIVQIFGRARAESPTAAFPWDRIGPYFTSGEFWNHYNTHYLWFLYYLMMFYLFIVVVRYLLLRIERGVRFIDWVDHWVQHLCNTPYAALWLIIPTLIPLSLMSGPITDEPGFSIVPQIGPFFLYLMFFGFGWFVHRRIERLNELKRYWKVHLISGTSVFLVIYAIIVIAMLVMKPWDQGQVGASDAANPQNQDIASATETIETSKIEDMIASATDSVSMDEITSVSPAEASKRIASASAGIPTSASGEAIASVGGEMGPPGPPQMNAGMFIAFTAIRSLSAFLMWSLTLGAVGAFLTFFEWHHLTFRYIADSAYWLYLAHVPVLMYVQIQIAYWPLHWSIKLILIHLFVLPILFITYHFLVRPTWIGKILNGRRYPISWSRRGTSPLTPKLSH